MGCVITEVGGNGNSNGNGGGIGQGGNGNGGGQTGDTCNPVTDDGCPTDGTTCDLAPSGFFGCYPPPNTVDVCGTCDPTNGPFCGPDLTCVVGSNGGICFRYCCTDGDCGAGGTCDVDFANTVLPQENTGNNVGLCVTSTGGQVPACGAPGASPSGGACVTGFGSGTGSSSSGGTGGAGSSGGTGGAGGGSSTSSGGMLQDAGGYMPGDGGWHHSDAGRGG